MSMDGGGWDEFERYGEMPPGITEDDFRRYLEARFEQTRLRREEAEKKITMKPIILTCGAHGYGLVFGYVEQEPVPGQPVKLHKARMILKFCSGGTFGLAADGPPQGARVTKAVSVTVETVWQEWIACSDEAAEAFDALP